MTAVAIGLAGEAIEHVVAARGGDARRGAVLHDLREIAVRIKRVILFSDIASRDRALAALGRAVQRVVDRRDGLAVRIGAADNIAVAVRRGGFSCAAVRGAGPRLAGAAIERVVAERGDVLVRVGLGETIAVLVVAKVRGMAERIVHFDQAVRAVVVIRPSAVLPRRPRPAGSVAVAVDRVRRDLMRAVRV